MLLFLFPLRVFIFHKLQMQMWLCPFPINSSRHRVSSRSQPQFLYRTKITKGGASVQAIVWQYSHPQHSIGIEISTERRMNGKGGGSGGDLSDSSTSPSADSWLVTLLFGAVSSLAVAMCPSLVEFIPSRLESLMILTTVDGVNNKNFTISLQMIVWCIELLYIKFLAELLAPSRANVERKFSKLSILYYFICVWLPCEFILITFICISFFLFFSIWKCALNGWYFAFAQARCNGSVTFPLQFYWMCKRFSGWWNRSANVWSQILCQDVMEAEWEPATETVQMSPTEMKRIWLLWLALW